MIKAIERRQNYQSKQSTNWRQTCASHVPIAQRMDAPQILIRSYRPSSDKEAEQPGLRRYRRDLTSKGQIGLYSKRLVNDTTH